MGQVTVFRQAVAVLISTAAGLFLSPPPLAAQSPEWSVHYGREHAETSTSGVEATWTTDRFEAKWVQTDRGGWVSAIERQKRNSRSDIAFVSLGYRRAGDWTFSADVAVTPRADFLYRTKVGGEISYRVIGTFVTSVGYHYLRFPSADIHQVEPALTWYYRKGEIQGRMYISGNATRDRTSTAALMRGAFDVTRRLRLAGGVAVGDRIFDIASLPFSSARSRVGFAETRVGLSVHDFITAGVMVGHEDPAFAYTSLTLSYRRVF